ncbi:MAG: ABC transporter substrate-binding protein [Polyangiaceae bacterium]|nr:ABC transporter substrate-binding protein [Polyangiaceae bacterium]
MSARRTQATPIPTTTRRRWQALALVASLAGCRGGDARRPALEVVIGEPPATLDPRYCTDAAGMRVSRLAHAGLVRLDPDTMEPRPYVAESLEWAGDREVRVTLRPGVRFAEADREVTPADVCATLGALADPRVASPHRAVASSFGACTQTGPRALSLRLDLPRATVETDLEVPILRADEARSPPRPDGSLDGLGPFRVRGSQAGQIELEAREGGALPRPAHDVVVRVVRDENARALRLLAGKADVVPNGLSPPLLSAVSSEGYAVVRRPGAGFTYLVPRADQAPFRDADVRRAVALALDRPLLARTLLGGATVADGPLSPASWAYVPPTETITRDVGRARSTFAAHGVSRLTLLVSSDRARGVLARAIAQMLGEAGVEVEVQPLELGVLLSRLSVGEFELALLQIPEVGEPNVLRWFFHSASTPEGGHGANRARFRDAEIDAALDEASVVPDRARRRAAYARALARMYAQTPVIPLFHEDHVAAVSARAATFAPSVDGRWLGLATVR